MGNGVQRVLHITHSAGSGGADIAAHRIHESLVASGVDSSMVVAVGDSGGLHLPHDRRWSFLRTHVTDWVLRTQKSSNGVHRSLNLIPSGAGPWIQSWKKEAGPDSVIHLHWLGSDTLSLAEIGELPGPVVWTLHDSWPFCGAEHHPASLKDDRFARGYTRSSRQPGDSRLDVDAWTYRRKERLWKRPFYLVGPSRWMVEQASRSSLAAEWPSVVIPNPIDVRTFTTGDMQSNRRDLGLPTDVPLVLFTSLGGTAFANKGWDLLEAALAMVAERVPGVEAVVVGSDKSVVLESMPVHNIGRVDDPKKMAQVYSACSVFVNPSRMESFSQTAAEAQACGVPVVAFAHTGLLDVVASGETGTLVPAYSVSDLAGAIEALLTDPLLAESFGTAARQRAVRLWAPDVVAGQYVTAYEQALDTYPG